MQKSPLANRPLGSFFCHEFKTLRTLRALCEIMFLTPASLEDTEGTEKKHFKIKRTWFCYFWIPAFAGMTNYPFVIPAQAGIQARMLLSFLRKQESRLLYWQIFSYKSSHKGLLVSINLIFQALFHLFICFSLLIADSQNSWTSYQTK